MSPRRHWSYVFMLPRLLKNSAESMRVTQVSSLATSPSFSLSWSWPVWSPPAPPSSHSEHPICQINFNYHVSCSKHQKMSFPIIHEIFDVSFLLTCVDVKQWSNLVRLGHPRGLYENVVELVVALGQLDNLVNQIVLESNIFVNNILLGKPNSPAECSRYSRSASRSWPRPTVSAPCCRSDSYLC